MNGLNPCLTIDQNNRTQFHLSALNDNRRLLEQCMELIKNYTEAEKKAALSDQDNEKNTALHIAAESNNVYAASILIKNNIDINLTNNHNLTAIGVALREKNIAIFDMLLNSKDSNLNHNPDKIGCILAILGDTSRLDNFITKAAPLWNANQNEWSPLDCAILANQPNMALHLKTKQNLSSDPKIARNDTNYYMDKIKNWSYMHEEDIITGIEILISAILLGGLIKTSIPEFVRIIGFLLITGKIVPTETKTSQESNKSAGLWEEASKWSEKQKKDTGYAFYDTKLFMTSTLQSIFGLLAKMLVIPDILSPLIQTFVEYLFGKHQFESKEELADFVLTTSDRYIAIKNCEQNDTELVIVALGNLPLPICKKNNIDTTSATSAEQEESRVNIYTPDNQCLLDPSHSINNQTMAHFIHDIIGVCYRESSGKMDCYQKIQPVRQFKVCDPENTEYCSWKCDYTGLGKYEDCYHT